MPLDRRGAAQSSRRGLAFGLWASGPFHSWFWGPLGRWFGGWLPLRFSTGSWGHARHAKPSDELAHHKGLPLAWVEPLHPSRMTCRDHTSEIIRPLMHEKLWTVAVRILLWHGQEWPMRSQTMLTLLLPRRSWCIIRLHRRAFRKPVLITDPGYAPISYFPIAPWIWL